VHPIKKGVFKNSGTQLTEDEQLEELNKLNPYHGNMAYGMRPSSSRIKKLGYVHSTLKSQGPKYGTVESEDEMLDDTAAVDELTKGSNSTGTFVPPYWTFVYCNSSLRDYCFITFIYA
jgi:hypothetical protein